MLHLHLVRHGETADNQERRYLGRRDLPLSEQGLEQARSLAQRLREVPVDRLYASPLTRALQTAAEIAQERHLTVIRDPRWVELDFGCWDGLTFAEISQRYPDEQKRWLADPEHSAPPQGECVRQLRLRIRGALEEIWKDQVDQTVLVVTHGGPIRLAVNLLTGQPIWEVELPCAGVCHVIWDGQHAHIEPGQ